MSVQFDYRNHIQNILADHAVNLVGPDGSALSGIQGAIGAAGIIEGGIEIGVDRIMMQPGSEFELHTHPGAHILYVLKSRGFIHIDGVDYEMGEGDTVYVPANYAHGVKTNSKVDDPLELLSFGVPHMPLESAKRMTLVK